LHQGCNIPFYKNIKTLDDDAFNKIRENNQTYFGSILCQFMNKCTEKILILIGLTKGNIVEGIHLLNYERDSIKENI
jgi:tRNA(Ile)-lysidine synthase TilS/MesJ